MRLFMVALLGLTAQVLRAQETKTNRPLVQDKSVDVERIARLGGTVESLKLQLETERTRPNVSLISSDTLFHFTSSRENLVSILTQEFRPHRPGVPVAWRGQYGF